MDCKETQRCIRLFLNGELDRRTEQKFVEHIRSCQECREELTIEYLFNVAIERLENAEVFDVERELEEKLNRAVNRKKVHGQLKAGFFVVASMVMCILLLF